MTASEALLIRNLLNGVSIEAAARASGLTVEDAGSVFKEAMRRVEEFQLVHGVPFFPVANLIEARRRRLDVLRILHEIQNWDDSERELALAMLSGRDVVREGADRAEAERVLKRVLDALPCYLARADQVAYYRNRKAFLQKNRGRLRELVERFVSFRAPLLHKNIIHVTVSSRDELLATMRNAQ